MTSYDEFGRPVYSSINRLHVSDDYGFKWYCQFQTGNFFETLETLNTFFYKNCILCDAVSTQNFCDACFRLLPAVPDNHCPVCLKSLASASLPEHQPQPCGACLSKPPAYDATIAALTYRFPVDALIHALKYHSRLEIAPILAKLLIHHLELLDATEKPDLIIPMPLHPIRLRERGYNQAMEIARHISKELKIKIIPNGCRRTRNTPPQAELPWKLRQENVRNTFDCTHDFSGKHVAVVDDVMTTGATLNAMAQQLRKKGTVKISNWIIARVQIERFYTGPDFNF